jgi:anti-sigma regulatory factor (Ser/Thr protein kinase)
VSLEVSVPEAATAEGLRHVVFFYRGIADYRAAIAGFVRTGLARKEPVFVAVPQPGAAVPDWPAGHSALVTVTDMAQLGRNPARLIGALRSFADRHRGRRPLIVTESVWPGRPAAEMCEAARIDALIDQALIGLQATLMCPYDAAGLPPDAIADATRAHQWRFESDVVVLSQGYSGHDSAPAACRLPLTEPPPGAQLVRYRTDLRPVRAMVTAACERAGLSAMRATDMTLAVSELAANTLQHTRAEGVAQAWQAGGELVCQISDSGFISDPLAGFLQPQPDQPGGHGLWLVNQICDLVEVRSGQEGTVIRLHMWLDRR